MPRKKQCRVCKEVKPLEEFHRNKDKKDGRVNKCKPCNRAANRAWKKANPQKVAEHDRRYRQKHKEQIADVLRRARARHPEKNRARSIVNLAVAEGRLVKPDACERCARRVEESRELHAHHHDYSEPYDIEWLCQSCHREEHRNTDALKPFEAEEGSGG